MFDLLDKIEQCDVRKQHYVFTVVKGQHMGEKALYVKEENQLQMVWTSVEDGFFHINHMTCPKQKEKSQIYEIAGEQVYLDSIQGERKLVICGAGHVSIPVITIGKMLGFHVTVIEDRPVFADHARATGADEVYCDEFDAILKNLISDEETYFVIVTRGHRFDHVCLREIAKKPHAYIGMMGSKKRVIALKQLLIEEGSDADVINSICSPIGLAIGAETPAELAVSIMGEIIQQSNQRVRTCGYAKDIIHAMREIIGKQQAVLTTIITRKGSAPRAVGTKMLVLEDGRTVDTIGGGCLEAEVIKKALLFLYEENQAKVITVDLSGKDAAEEGMVCGGTIEVLLERV